MNNLLAKIKLIAERLRAFFPQTLPQGRTEAEAWADSIIRLSGLPDNGSVRFALYVKVLHLGETDDRKPKEYFIRAMRKAAANQVVSTIINEIKENQQAEQKAAQEKQLAEATAKQSAELPHESQG